VPSCQSVTLGYRTGFAALEAPGRKYK
jgi:hypothetical protein